MSKKETLIVNQPFGLGDILYVQNICNHLSQTKRVIYPVSPEFMWITEYYKHLEVEYRNRDDFPIAYDDHEMKRGYLPLRFASQVIYSLWKWDFSHDATVMEDKYHLIGLDPQSWRETLWKRKEEKELELFNKLGLSEDEPYIIVNTMYGSATVGTGEAPIDLKDTGDKKIVNTSYVDGYTLLDWGLVYEKASEVHTVSTATCWVIDGVCSDKTKKFIYPRPNQPDNEGFLPLKKSLSSDWIFVGVDDV